MARESTIHIRNLKFLLTKVYKFSNGLSPPIMYDLRSPRILASKHKSTIKYDINTILLKGSSNFGKRSETRNHLVFSNQI